MKFLATMEFEVGELFLEDIQLAQSKGLATQRVTSYAVGENGTSKESDLIFGHIDALKEWLEESELEES